MLAKMGHMLGQSPEGIHSLLAPLLPAPKPPPADISECAMWKQTRDARHSKEKAEGQHKRAAKAFESAKQAFENAQGKLNEAKEKMENATECFLAARARYQEEHPIRAAQRGDGNDDCDFDMEPEDLYEQCGYEEEIHGIPVELAQEREELRESIARAAEAREAIKRANDQGKAFQAKVKRFKVDQSQGSSNGIYIPTSATGDSSQHQLGAEEAAAGIANAFRS